MLRRALPRQAAPSVETQVLADTHGNVVVVGTRDCSLQRRYQKLVEEAPAPFLTEAQTKAIYDASKAICKEAGYVGAGASEEFSIGQDGLVSFLEVNTRLQVEHPVTEEITGVDLVRSQFAIADGLELDFDDPAPAATRSLSSTAAASASSPGSTRSREETNVTCEPRAR